MNSIENAKDQLKQLADQSKFEKMVHVSAILTSLLHEYQIKPIIVGGLAVEIYTRSEYTTSDIDLVSDGRDIIDHLLVQLDFKREGRHWMHKDLLVSIEIPSNRLEDADENRIVQFNLKNSQQIYVIGIEDIILDRLRACTHWESSSDCEWGKRLFLLHYDRLDIKYMKEMAVKDKTISLLTAWLYKI